MFFSLLEGRLVGRNYTFGVALPCCQTKSNPKVESPMLKVVFVKLENCFSFFQEHLPRIWLANNSNSCLANVAHFRVKF